MSPTSDVYRSKMLEMAAGKQLEAKTWSVPRMGTADHEQMEFEEDRTSGKRSKVTGVRRNWFREGKVLSRTARRAERTIGHGSL